MHAVVETHDVLGRLCEIGQPTLVLTGMEDVLIPPQNSRLIAERIPHARLIEYADAGHGFLEETEMQAIDDALTEALRVYAFLREIAYLPGSCQLPGR